MSHQCLKNAPMSKNLDIQEQNNAPMSKNLDIQEQNNAPMSKNLDIGIKVKINDNDISDIGNTSLFKKNHF